ncbi:MAG: arginyltransferase [Deltaproteobacteria bacterium]|nr:arginyltransferase [Deltaproteobacteria bacterium]
MAREKLIHDGLQSCPYLPDRLARMPMYRQLDRLGPPEADARFARSERRVGSSLYRPQCPSCQACMGIRVPVEGFQPSKSQRRVLRRWQQVGGAVEGASPSWSPEKLALFNRHKVERGLSQNEQAFSPVGYVSWLIQTCTDTVELQYRVGSRLVGVSILDLGARSASSVYFYFDPDPALSHLSLGTLSALHEIDLCARTGRTHYYLGLYVEGNDHMRYKTSFRPYELLQGEVWTRHPQR